MALPRLFVGNQGEDVSSDVTGEFTGSLHGGGRIRILNNRDVRVCQTATGQYSQEEPHCLSDMHSLLLVGPIQSISTAEGFFDMNTVVAGILLLTAFALTLDWAVGIAERRLMVWQPRPSETERT